MHKIHRPDVVWSDCNLPVLAQLGLDPPLGMPVSELETQLFVNSTRFFMLITQPSRRNRT
ncbi:hypothetical protein LF95_22435 [Thalassospira sp. TSL5-1]|nr:hypothetical protein LF95_22435 [Thalassospira sp. TSL5-1]